MSHVDLVAITQALREAAEQIRALPDGDLVAMALRAQQASEVGRSPAAAGSGRDVSSEQGSTRSPSRRAEAPKSPAPSEEASSDASAPFYEARAQKVVELIRLHGPLTRSQIFARIGVSKTGSSAVKLFEALRLRPDLVAPRAGSREPWRLA